MNAETERLIARLTAEGTPVAPLLPPWQRALVWFALSLPVMAGFVWLMGPRSDLMLALTTPRYLIEQLASLATAATAVWSAFALVRPGSDRRMVWAPVLPGLVWISSLGAGCVVDLRARDLHLLELTPELECFAYISAIGAVPAALAIALLRRGAPLAPRLTLFLAVLGAAALGNFGLRLFHAQESALMVVVWQMGSVAALSALAGLMGPRVLRWRHTHGGLQG